MPNDVCAIMQPTYNPWLGYFDLLDKVDTFVFLDNVQLVKRSWQTRNRIKTPKGELFLSIPVITPNGQKTLIKDAIIDDTQKWRKKHLRAIEINYRSSPFFDKVFPFIKDLLFFKTKNLADFNINFIQKIAWKIGINSTKIIRASQLEPLEGKKDKRLVEICKKIQCNIYISPQGSASYIEKENPGGAFPSAGIQLYYHNYEHPIYPQLYPPFIPFMGIIDLLFNVGFDKALQIIRKGRKKDIYYSEFRRMNNEKIK